MYEPAAIDHQITLKLMEDQLHVNREIIYPILHEGFGKRTVSAKFLS